MLGLVVSARLASALRRIAPPRGAVFGALFGTCFPLAAWSLDLVIHGFDWSLGGLIRMHLANPLHWIIDLAPLVLGTMGWVISIAQSRLTQSEARHRDLVENGEGLIFTHDLDGVLLSINPAAERSLGYGPRTLSGRNLNAFLGPPVGAFETYLRRARGTGVVSGTLRMVTQQGAERIWAYTNSLHESQGEAIYVRGHAQDITERTRAEAALRRQALHDGLTGLPNRELLNARLEEAIDGAGDDGSTFALLLLDLDHFKDVNDALGHHAGDLLLRLIGPRLQGPLRPEDTLARLGGDEFAVLMPGTDEASARAAGRKLLRTLDEPFDLDGSSVDIGGSLGVVLFPEHGQDAEVLMRRADVAMYVAKRAGNGCVVYDREQDHHSPEGLAFRRELRQAIDHGELELYYQPKRACLGGRLMGMEALVRWPHPTRGLVMPDEFIPLAEQTGLIAALSHWVLEAAVRQCRIWKDSGLEIPVAVNLSMRDLHDVRLPDTIEHLLAVWDVPPRLLHVEITESSLMVDPDRARQTVARLSKLGVQIAIDDFGAGYSSLAYLKKLPVDELKIDRSFVSDMGTDPSDRAIVRSTIELAHNLGLRVVAEGVEDEATARLLTELGCDEAQGYHLGRPQPAAAITAGEAPPPASLAA
jgi:diguanylate cyclase (GGDEF)-like protein/PAS domain S-box-containing protein